ncbi:carbohydrate ABC transporter permease [Bifidobacterium pseudocatenulatum]|uniref:carbohydrate ABC transporter permease n=1 Tax=Bifidobacterium pseudocatenulatum TaxID=28026 RepID=UPI0018AC487A|nr:sugar ABC transporter permease [Bifidobacterium pseudocatenulatum]
MSSTSKDAVTLRAKRSKKPSDGKMRRNVEIFVLSAPAILLFVCFVILPIVLGAYYGFYQWKGYGLPSKTGKFVGLQNYITAIKDPAFQAAILHTFEVVIGSLVIQAPLAINEILANFGINGPDWLADPKIAIWTLLLLISWKYVGFAVILMLAGMQSIPDELYEAAKVDGASFWQMQRSITLPLLAPTLRIWVFLSMIGSLQLFDLVYIVWGKYVSTTAGVSTMATYMVREGRGAGNYGYGSAVALIIFVISLIIALVYQKFVLNRDLDGAVTEQKEAEKRARKRAKEVQHREVAALASEVK